MSAAARRLADALPYAATPSLAAMALLTAAGAGPAWLCGGDAWGVGGMAPMYALMALLHAPPWLRLAGRRICARELRPISTHSPAN